jgi:DNA-binding transcriptional MerR regulator
VSKVNYLLTSIKYYFILSTMKNEKIEGLLKISGLAKAAEVSVSMIHYYVQQGLLTPPVKTSRNMAYYDPRCIQEIHLIQELQAKQYLPLSIIKLILGAKREGQSSEHVFEMRSSMEEIFQPLGNGAEPRNLTFDELISASGLPGPEINAIEAKGLIKPQKTEKGLRYDDTDLRLAQLFKKLAGFGLKPDDLDIYRQSVKTLRLEARAIHQVLHRLPDHENIPIRELLKILNDFKRYLAIKIYREEVQKFNEPPFLEENKP